MPRDLFGVPQLPDVGSRSRYTVPLSFAAHAAAILAVAGATVLGPVVLPGLATSDIVYRMVTVPPPPLPPAPRLASAPARVTPNPGAAPTQAPDGIAPEPDVPYEPTTALEPGPGSLLGVTNFDIVAGEPPLPPPPVKPSPVRPGSQVRPPTKIRDVAPVYPALAQAARQQGTVILEALIDTDGRVQSVRVLRSLPLLDGAAIEAVSQWQYTPTLLNGTPVPVVMSVTVTFQLR